MLLINNVRLEFNPNVLYPSYEDIISFGKNYISKLINQSINSIELYKKSLDFRHGKCSLILSYLFCVNNENLDSYVNITKFNKELIVEKEQSFNHIKKKCVIVGAGPSGLFSCLVLQENGFDCILVEQGSMIEDRIKDVDEFIKNKKLNPLSNIQFGEGGAGTFSDGKLFTGGNNPLNRYVLETFVKFGAPSDILYDAHPHVGTDILRNVIINFRKYLISLGAKIYFNTKFIDFDDSNCYFDSKLVDKESYDYLILSTGHSSYDTFKLLKEKNVLMNPKNFAIGCRIEHKRVEVNKSMYHGDYKMLPTAIYKFVEHLSNGRSCYTFCMCPGGFVVNATSDEESICVNGMSNHDRMNTNSNSALLVDIRVDDYYHGDILDGIKYIKDIEHLAYKYGNGNVIVTKVDDFLNKRTTTSLGSVTPSIKGGYILGDVSKVLPNFVSDSLREGIINFSKKASFFKNNDAVLSGVESRTSSPIKIERTDSFETSINNIYAVGEGSGHAGGIVTSATDAIKVALKILEGNRL